MVVDVITSVLLLTGVGLALLAGIGLQQFEDVFARIHAATKAITLGLLLIGIAACLQVQDRGDIAKILLAVSLQFITAPVSAHMIGRAAYRAGTELGPSTVVDELADAKRRRTGNPDGIPDPPPPGVPGND
jgi:multicomponent Na+:H+ antiporter subunit G